MAGHKTNGDTKGDAPRTSNDSSAPLQPDKQADNRKHLVEPALKWGIRPSEPNDRAKEPGPDHPVHKVPLKTQEKWRKKGINPVLRAEMDEAQKGEGGFWAKVAGTAMGGGWIK